jgi:hypothetical protein
MNNYFKPLFISIMIHTVSAASSVVLYMSILSPSSKFRLPVQQTLTTDVCFITPQNALESKALAASTHGVQQRKINLLHPPKKAQSTVLSKHNQESNNNGSSLPDAIPFDANQHPQYPESERTRGREAVCLVRFDIPSSGIPCHIQNTSAGTCPEVFFTAAKQAISSWMFKRTSCLTVSKSIPIIFKFQD